MKTVSLFFSFSSEFHFGQCLNWLAAYRSENKLPDFQNKFLPGKDGEHCRYFIRVPAAHAETIKWAVLAFNAEMAK